MTILYAQCSMQMFTNLPRDVITNGWHFVTNDLDTPEGEALTAAARLQTFYGTALNGYVSNYVAGTTMRIKVYDLSDPEPRAPVLDSTITPAWGTKTPSAIPTEVSVVLSFHASPTSGVPAGRLRNRVYLGGIGGGAVTASTSTTFPMIDPALITKINTAATALKTANTAGVAWVGVSRASGLAVTFPIVGGWTDNSPDTQRRRGINATSRTLWS